MDTHCNCMTFLQGSILLVKLKIWQLWSFLASLVAQMVKNLPAMQETWVWSLGLIPGLGRSPGEEKGYPFQYSWASPVAQLVKNLPAMQETWVWSLGLIPGLGRSPGEEKGYPFQYPGLENSTDCIVHRFTKSWTWLGYFASLCEEVKYLFWVLSDKVFELSCGPKD